MEPRLGISSYKAGDVLVVAVRGELDLGTAPEFRARVDADLDRFGCLDLVLDFSGVVFMDSSGLGALLGRYRTVGAKGGRLVVAGPPPHVGKLLALSGTLRVVEVHPTVEAGILALGGKRERTGGEDR